jgi:hypothetical protein
MSSGNEPKLDLLLAGTTSDGSRRRRLLPEGDVMVLCSPLPFHAPRETLDLGITDQMMLVSLRHVPSMGIFLDL